MTYKTKATIIQSIVLIIGTILMTVSISFFQSKELIELTRLSACILTTIMGLHFLFGKYIYISGLVITKSLRIQMGLFMLLIMPILLLIYYITGKFN